MIPLFIAYLLKLSPQIAIIESTNYERADDDERRFTAAGNNQIKKRKGRVRTCAQLSGARNL